MSFNKISARLLVGVIWVIQGMVSVGAEASSMRIFCPTRTQTAISRNIQFSRFGMIEERSTDKYPDL